MVASHHFVFTVSYLLFVFLNPAAAACISVKMLSNKNALFERQCFSISSLRFSVSDGFHDGICIITDSHVWLSF